MLARLQIENYALIESLALDFAPGLNVLTGETGSGKSIIVDALGLLLGARADGAAIRSGAAAAVVSGIFACPFARGDARLAFGNTHGLNELGDEILLRREIAPGGRGRISIDNQPATLALLRQLGPALGEIHSQHEALAGFHPAAQLELLDRFAAHAARLAAIAAAYAEWRQADERCRAFESAAAERLRQADLWRFQVQEIGAAAPLPDEDAALEGERRRLANADRIAAAAQNGYAALYDAPEAAAVSLKNALRQVQELERLGVPAAGMAPRLESLRAEVQDLAAQLRDLGDAVETAPGRLAEIEERLSLLDRLKRKYGGSLAAVLQARDQAAALLEQVENADAHRVAAAATVAAAAAAFLRLARDLSRRRRQAAAQIRTAVEREGADLGMPLRFAVEFEPADPEPDPAPAEWGPSGWDRIRFIASTNPGEPLGPVREIASGGELSRLLLALYVALERAAPAAESAEHTAPRTMVLDEVDAGIGGRAAEAVGAKMQRLGRHYQLLCVTHLAPIATFAAHHLRVEKRTAAGRTRTEARALIGPERIEEIARMLAGQRLNPTALKHAEELLAAHAGDAPG